MQLHGRALEPEHLAEPVGQVALVAVVHTLGRVAVRDERGGSNAGLRHVVDAHWAVVPLRRRVRDEGILEEAVELRGGDTRVEVLEDLLDQGEDPLHAFAGLGRDEQVWRPARVGQPALQLLFDGVLLTSSISLEIPLVDDDESTPRLPPAGRAWRLDRWGLPCRPSSTKRRDSARSLESSAG